MAYGGVAKLSLLDVPMTQKLKSLGEKMSRRRRGKTNNTPIIAIIIAAICIGGLVFLINSGSFSGGDSSCGSREEDTERSGYCVTTKSDYDELVIVTGNTQNTPAPNLDFTQGELYKILGGVFYNAERGSSPSVSIVSASGNNRTIEYKAKYKVAQNVIASNNELRKLGKELNDAIKSSPLEPGADYLGGILEANNLISNTADNPLIIVIGSGYNDSGALNFASNDILNLYWQNADSITSILSQNRRTKEGILNGTAIYWYNIGDVVAPQPNMNKYKEDIKGIYELAFNYLGAGRISLNNYTGVTANAQSVPSEYSVQQTYVDELKIGDTFSVNENVGRFYPDKDVLINPSEVKEKLSSFAKRFNPNSNTKLKLTGYIAFCVDEGQLGLLRAETIKGVLIELGIPGDKIETHGERGSPPESPNETYTCQSTLPETERRTVQIEVIKD